MSETRKDESDHGQGQKKRRTAPLRIGGVPEHFNFPFFLAKEQGIFEKHGVEVEFVEQKLGTGAMIKNVKSGELDVCVALTEGLVSDIAGGSDLRLLGTYVGSPLCWAVSAGKDSDIKSVADLKGKTFGISRPTSGSQLMAYVMAGERGWDPQNDVKFEVKGSFENLRASVNDGSTQAFLWETFTTKPFHDSGEVRRVGEITTPWPCFMLAARQPVITSKLEQLQKALAAVHEAVQLFHHDKSYATVIAERYKLKPEDAKAWYAGVNIVAERYVSETALQRAVDTLQLTGVLPPAKVDIAGLIDSRFAEIQRGIKEMPLYSAKSRPAFLMALFRQLTAANLVAGSIKYTQLLPYDQHHYHGVQSLDSLIASQALTSNSRVFNVGSGLGGPARYLAGKVGCTVTACEIQDDIHRAASELTERCGLNNLVQHVGGDFLQVADTMQQSSYDLVVSWLTILHFSDRPRMYKAAYDLLRPGGVFVASDFYELGKLSVLQWKTLYHDVGCPGMPSSLECFQHELEVAGFKVTTVTDKSDDWRQYTAERVKAFQENSELRKVIGEDVHASQLQFYTLVRDLYASKNLGGCIVVAQKPMGW